MGLPPACKSMSHLQLETLELVVQELAGVGDSTAVEAMGPKLGESGHKGYHGMPPA